MWGSARDEKSGEKNFSVKKNFLFCSGEVKNNFHQCGYCRFMRKLFSSAHAFSFCNGVIDVKFPKF